MSTQCLERTRKIIREVNLGVAPETRILIKTNDDIKWVPIKDLKNQIIVKVWNGEKWSETTVKKTGSNQKLLRVQFNKGSIINCTEYHKFYIKEWLWTKWKYETKVYKAKDLRMGMQIIDHNIPEELNGYMLYEDRYKKYDSFLNRCTNYKNQIVREVFDEGRFDDTYCFTEKERGMCMFEGVLLGNGAANTTTRTL